MWPVYYSVSLIHTSERAVMFIQITMWLEYTTTDRKSSNQQIHEIVIERQQHFFSIDKNSICHLPSLLPLLPCCHLRLKLWQFIRTQTNDKLKWICNFCRRLTCLKFYQIENETTRYDVWQSMWQRWNDHNEKAKWLEMMDDRKTKEGERAIE